MCFHVASEGLPILYAERSQPVSAEDSGWQFVCNSGRLEDEKQAQVWSLKKCLHWTQSSECRNRSRRNTRLSKRQADSLGRRSFRNPIARESRGCLCFEKRAAHYDAC